MIVSVSILGNMAESDVMPSELGMIEKPLGNWKNVIKEGRENRQINGVKSASGGSVKPLAWLPD